MSFKIVKMAKAGQFGGHWKVVGQSMRQTISSAPQTPCMANPRGLIPVRGQGSRNWTVSKGQAAKTSHCKSEAEGAQ